MLRKRIAGYVLVYLSFVFFDTVQAAPVKNVIVTKDEVVIYPHHNFSYNNIRTVRAQVVSDKIARAIASPVKGVPERESLVTVYPAASGSWLYKQNIANRQREWIGKGYTSILVMAIHPLTMQLPITSGR